MRQFKVLRSLNNNVVLSERNQKFYIIIAKGIGFDKQYGDVVEKPEDAHYYLLRDEGNLHAYEKVLLDVDEKILFATEKAIQYAEKTLKHKFNESLHLSLLDHLNFAIYRYQHGLELSGFFVEEYHYMYPELYEVAKEMVDIINEAMEVSLPTSEIASVILHLHAALRKETVSQRAYYNQIIQEALNFISRELDQNLVESKLSSVRLATHLRFTLERERKGERLDPKMIVVIEQCYQKSYYLAKSLCEYLNENFELSLPDEEIAYLALHIENIRKDSKEEKHV